MAPAEMPSPATPPATVLTATTRAGIRTAGRIRRAFRFTTRILLQLTATPRIGLTLRSSTITTTLDAATGLSGETITVAQWLSNSYPVIHRAGDWPWYGK